MKDEWERLPLCSRIFLWVLCVSLGGLALSAATLALCYAWKTITDLRLI